MEPLVSSSVSRDFLERFSVPILQSKIVRLQLFSRILHQYKFLSIGLVVEAFPLVLGASAIKFLVQESQSKVKVSLPVNLLARNVDQIGCFATTSLPVLVRQLLYSSHNSETATWTLS